MYPFLFQAASFHIQDMETVGSISQYIPHVDKVGLITAFYQVQGISYNFVAVQDIKIKDNEVKFQTSDDYSRYKHYKEQLDEKEKRKLNAFEENIFKLGKDKKFTKIIVKQLLVGHYMVFAAGIYPHGTVIPKQSETRSLLVFHDFLPC